MGSQEYSGAVGVVVNGPAEIKQIYREPGTNLLSEDQFKKLTGIHASWPARLGFLRLLEEDVKVRDLRSMWEDELTFVGNQFSISVRPLYLYLTQMMGAVVLLSALCLVAVLVTVGDNWKPRQFQAFMFVLTVFWLGIVAIFASVIRGFYRPYKLGIKLQKILPLVNRDLPERIANELLRLRRLDSF